MYRVGLAFLATLLLVTTAEAQRQPTVEEGARVRLVLRDPPSTWVGIALPSTPDSLVVQYPSGEVFRASLGQLDRLQVSSGMRSHAVYGAGVGALGGIVLGLMFESLGIQILCSEGPPPEDVWVPFWSECPEKRYAARAIGGGLLGAVIGGMVGSFIKTERWVSVRLNFRSP